MGYITLLSDFGLQDASVASVKGELAQLVPDTDIIDISHFVEPFHLQQAAYLLASTYKSFPSGTCHVVLCDIFSENEPRLLLCEYEGQYFLTPDNGVISLALGNIERVWQCSVQSDKKSVHNWINEVGKIIQELQLKKPVDMGLNTTELKYAPQHWRPKIEGSNVECQVIHIDRFGNVILNITSEQFIKIGRNRPFRIQLLRDEEIRDISINYSDVRAGEKLCRFNSAGYLEICINRGNAATLLGLRMYREHHIMYNSIKIFFE